MNIHPDEVVEVRVYGNTSSFMFETTWEEVFMDNPDLAHKRAELERDMNVRFSCNLNDVCSVFRRL